MKYAAEPTLENMKRSAKALKLKVANGDLTKMRAALERALVEQFPDADVLECGDCGFESPEVSEIESCPGCGARFVEEGEQTNVATPEIGPEESQQVSAGKPLPGTASAATPKLAVVKADAARERDRLEGEIDGLVQNFKATGWEIGQRLLELESQNLWMLAKNQHDAQAKGHSSFTAYIRSRFPFTPQAARSFMEMARTFGAAEMQKAQLPETHMMLIAKVPDDERRKELVEEAKREKLTKREVAEKVKVERAERGLKAERAGFEGTILPTMKRHKVGATIATGKWKARRKGGAETYQAEIELGGQIYVLTDRGLDVGWDLVHKGPAD